MRFQFQNMIYSLDQRAVFGRRAWGKSPPAGSPSPLRVPFGVGYVARGAGAAAGRVPDPSQAQPLGGPLGGVQAAGAGLAVSTFARSERKQTECFPHKSTHCSSGEKHRGGLGSAGRVPVRRALKRHRWETEQKTRSGYCLQPGGHVEAACTQLSERLGWRETVFKGNPLKNPTLSSRVLSDSEQN